MGEHVPPHEKKNPYAAVKDFISGTSAGIAGKLVEYPFDTIKVRLQMAGAGNTESVRSIALQIYKTQGVMAIYKGVMSPVIGAAMEIGILFTVYGHATRLLLGDRKVDVVPMPIVGTAAAITGVFVSKILTPVELVKCRMQAQTDSTRVQPYRNTWHCFVKTVQDDGVVKGLFKGHTATLAREVPGNAGWFLTYEAICRTMIPEGKTKDDLHPAKVAAAGAAAGMVYWAAFYPADVIKSRMQTGVLPDGTGFGTAFATIFKKEGVRGLYRGLSITLMRAIPANAIIFTVYENLTKLQNKYY